MIYRSATVIVQNSTRQPLVTAGFGVVRGIGMTIRSRMPTE